VNASLEQLRDHGLEFAVPNQRIAAHYRQMQRADAVNHFKYAIYEFLAFSIMQAAQCHSASQMAVLIGVTSRTL
jgi:hypothetical protein